MQHLQPNTTLQGGKYRIERVLGQGGFGITYLAIQTSLNRYVAIKELFVGGSGQAINERRGNQVVVTNSVNQQSFNQQKAKFKKEALRLANLNHPNLVKVHEFFEENGTAYYVMDYIDGESLRTKLNREGKLSERLVLKYINQILPALDAAHKQSIWHLDIKPENIMVDRYDHAYLIDFGASKHIERCGTLTTSLALAYTPGYCAPELTDLLNESEEGFAEAMREIGPWTDTYSVGATMYNLLTDSIPPSSKRIERNGRKTFSFPSDVSSSTQDLIIRMMRPNREERPQSVAIIEEKNAEINNSESRTSNSGAIIAWYVLAAIIIIVVLIVGALSIGNSNDENRVANPITKNETIESTDNNVYENEIQEQNNVSLVFRTKTIDENEKTCELLPYCISPDYSGELRIPNDINGYKVILICNNAFSNCKEIKSIVIPNSVKDIGIYAFSGCSSLEKISIPASVSTIGEGAFQNCKSLISITLPNSITLVEKSIFRDCISLKSVIISNGVSEIKDNAFSGCKKLESINMPNSLNIIDSRAFENCQSLKTISIPNGVVKIGTLSFSGCSSLSSVTLPNSINTISMEAFSGCISLQSISIPEGVEYLYGGIFENCTSLRFVNLPNSLKGISNSMFRGCVNLESITSMMRNPCNFPESGFYNCKLYIPYGTRKLYEDKEYDKHFSSIIEQ